MLVNKLIQPVTETYRMNNVPDDQTKKCRYCGGTHKREKEMDDKRTFR